MHGGFGLRWVLTTAAGVCVQIVGSEGWCDCSGAGLPKDFSLCQDHFTSGSGTDACGTAIDPTNLDSTFPAQGGGIYVENITTAHSSSTTVTLKNVRITALPAAVLPGNKADLGGGIYNSEAKVTHHHATVSGNNATLDGGGVDTVNGTVVTLGDSTFSNNTADRDGGGILSDGTRLNIGASTINGNTYGRDGGGLALFQTTSGTSTAALTKWRNSSGSANPPP